MWSCGEGLEGSGGGFVTRSCAGCGRSFTPSASYYRYCSECFKARMVDEQKRERRRAFEAGYAAGWSAAQKQANGSSSSRFDRDLVRDLIRLRHPDLHPPERSPLATRVTQALLDLRRGAAS
jgi:hypothetical protein